VLPDISLYILAEVEGRGAVGVRQGNRDGRLYYLDEEDGEPEDVGASLREVIETELDLRRRADEEAG
jgi:hypothetical protein